METEEKQLLEQLGKSGFALSDRPEISRKHGFVSVGELRQITLCGIY